MYHAAPAIAPFAHEGGAVRRRRGLQPNPDKPEIRRGDRPGRPQALEDDRPYRNIAILRRIL